MAEVMKNTPEILDISILIKEMQNFIGRDIKDIFEEIIYDYLEKENISIEESYEMDIVDREVKKLAVILEEKNIQKGDIIEIKLLTNGIFNIIFKDENGQKKVLEIPKIFLEKETLEEQEKIEKHIEIYLESIKKAENLLSAMDYIFEENQKYIDNPYLDLNNEDFYLNPGSYRTAILDQKHSEKPYINYDDIIHTDIFGKDLRGKNLRDLQLLLKEQIDNILLLSLDKIDVDVNRFFDLEKEYFKMFMGIGEKYSGGAKFLLEEKGTVYAILVNILYNQEPIQFLNFLEDIYKNIYENKIRSGSVEESYAFFTEDIISIFVKDKYYMNFSDEELLRFARILSGRSKNLEKSFYCKYSSSDLASEVLGYLFTKNNLINHFFEGQGENYEDKEISNKNPQTIISDLEKNFIELYGNDIESRKEKVKKTPKESFKFFLKTNNYKEMLNLGNKKYSDLAFREKTKLTMLFRVNKKLTKLKQEKDNYKKNKTSHLYTDRYINTSISKNNFRLENFIKLFNETSKDYTQEILSNKNIFDKEFYFGKDFENLKNLTKIEKDALKLFKDMNGIGFFDFSDSTIDFGKGTGKFMAILAAGLIAPQIVGGSLVVQGALSGVFATAIYRQLYEKGYDSESEKMTDLLSDYSVNMIFGGVGGAVGGRMLKNLGKEITFGSRTSVLGAEMFASGGPEILRTGILLEIFGSSIFKENKEEIKKEYQKIDK